MSRDWLWGMSLLAALVGCGGGGEAETPVEVTYDNVRGYWYGELTVPVPEAENDPPQGPVMLHLGGVLPGVEGLDALAEWVRIAPFSLGRHRVEGERLFLEHFSPGVGWGSSRSFVIESLTRNTMVLLAETTPPERYTLTRGDSCAAGGVWWPLETGIDQAAFGPDGRLHTVQNGVYGHGVAGLCFPFERAEILTSKLAVSPSDEVLLGHVETGAIVLQRFEAPEGSTDPVEPTVERLELRDAQDSWIYDHLRLGFAGAVPVVLYARGATLHTWVEDAGAWVYEALPIPHTDNLTPTDLMVVAGPGELWVRRRGDDTAHVFDGAWRVETLPAHPTLGDPDVIAFDDGGGLHGAWVELSRDLAIWDPLVVGRHSESAGWKTGYAGVGSPWEMRVNADGSYDLIVGIARLSTSLGHVHVPKVGEPTWETHYGPDRFAVSGNLGADYMVEDIADQLLMQPWGVFGPDGALVMGGGGEPPFRQPWGLWKNPRRQEAERTGDRRLTIEFTGSLAAEVRFPTWGITCKVDCEHFVPSQSIVPITVKSDGLVTLKTRTPDTVGLSHVERMPDGTFAAVFEPDMFGLTAYDITLEVLAEPRAIGEVTTLLPEDVDHRPLLAVGDERPLLVRALGPDQDHRLERIAADGTVQGSIDLEAIEAVGLGANKVLAVTATELVSLTSDLDEVQRAPFTRPTRPYRVAATGERAVTVERLDDGLTSRITTHTSSGTTSVDVALPKLGPVALNGDLVAVLSDTESYARTLGVTEVPEQHLALAAFGLDGAAKWTLAVPKSAFRVARVAAHGDRIVWVVAQYQPHTFAANDPLAGLMPMTGAQLTHAFWIRADGTFEVVSSAEVPVRPELSIVANNDGVWLASGSDAHLSVTFIAKSGEVASRLFSARLPGECVQGSCPEEPLVLASAGKNLAVFHHQRGRALPLEETLLPAVLPPLSGQTALVVVLPLID